MPAWTWTLTIWSLTGYNRKWSKKRGFLVKALLLLAPTFPSHPSARCLPLTLPLPPSSPELMPPFTLRLSPCLTISHSLARLLSLFVSPSPSLFPPRPPVSGEADWPTPLLLPPPLPLSSSPFPAALPPRPTWPAVALMVVSRVGPRGLVEVEDSFSRPGPAWTAVWAYTTVFIPLSSSLYSSKALHFFLWVSRTAGREQEGQRLVEDAGD